MEFIRLYARHGFYQNHKYDAISRRRFNHLTIFFSAISREGGREEHSESYLSFVSFLP